MVARKKLLLVEDDLHFARYFLDAISDAAPHVEVFHINNGLAAMSVIKSGFRPDVIVSDAGLPKMNGYELLAKLKGEPRYASIPFVLCSAMLDDKEKNGATAEPADLRFARPMNYREMLALIDRIVSLCDGQRSAQGTRRGTATV
jgi:CheY-like chemotaxis protein